MYSEEPSVKTVRGRGTMTLQLLNTVQLIRPHQYTLGPSNNNKLLLEKLIYNHLRPIISITRKESDNRTWYSQQRGSKMAMHQHLQRKGIHRIVPSVCIWGNWLCYRPPPDRSPTDFLWISTNLFTLNSSKTEFLIIGLKRQLSKNRQLFTQYHSFCMQPWFYFWRTSYLLWSGHITF